MVVFVGCGCFLSSSSYLKPERLSALRNSGLSSSIAAHLVRLSGERAGETPGWVSLVGQKDVVDWDVDELDKEADEAHNGEANPDGAADAQELFLSRLRAAIHELGAFL